MIVRVYSSLFTIKKEFELLGKKRLIKIPLVQGLVFMFSLLGILIWDKLFGKEVLGWDLVIIPIFNGWFFASKTINQRVPVNFVWSYIKYFRESRFLVRYHSFKFDRYWSFNNVPGFLKIKKVKESMR